MKNNSAMSAKKAGLRYVHDSAPGISRIKSGKTFTYKFPDDRAVKDKDNLDRIKSLRIPPAWKDVWICHYSNGHLQATGRDERNRKQYLYHPKWREIKDETKYHRMLTFADALSKIRRKIKSDLEQKGVGRDRVLAAIIEIMEKTLIRVGNEEYAKENQSFGLTTLRNKHVEIIGQTLHFHFKGKSGVIHDVKINDPKAAKIVASCHELPGQELFCYKDESGKIHDINSGDVNDYLKKISGEEISAKDFRTWSGTLMAMQSLIKLSPCDSTSVRKKNVLKVVEDVASHLRNTKAVCKKCYINPCLIEKYLNGDSLEYPCRCKNLNGLHVAEHMLRHFLENSYGARNAVERH